MGEVKEPRREGAMSDAQLVALYEDLRAAEKNPSLGYPFADERLELNVNWDALQARALRPSLPERVRDAFAGVSPRVVAASMFLPVIGIIATFFWLRGVPVALTQEFALKVTVAAALMVLMSIWWTLSMQATARVVQSTVHELVLRETAPEPDAAPARLFQPVRVLASPHRLSFALFVGSAVVTIMAIAAVRDDSDARQTKAVDTLARDAAMMLTTDDFNNGSDKVETVSRETGPTRNRKVFYTTADLVYDQLMSLSTSDPTAAAQRDVLADQALRYLIRARRDEPKRAAVWTRLAEVYFLKGNVEEARKALKKVETLEDVPPLERARAEMILGYINARDISNALAGPELKNRAELETQLEQTIRKVQTAAQESNTDASALLTHLYLARAAMTNDPAEREKRREEAINYSVKALNAAPTILLAVERPPSLTRQVMNGAGNEPPPAEKTPVPDGKGTQ